MIGGQDKYLAACRACYFKSPSKRSADDSNKQQQPLQVSSNAKTASPAIKNAKKSPMKQRHLSGGTYKLKRITKSALHILKVLCRCIKTPRCSQRWGEWVERYQSRQKKNVLIFWYRPDDYVYVHIYASKNVYLSFFITGKENALVEAVVEPSMSLPTQVVKKLILWNAATHWVQWDEIFTNCYMYVHRIWLMYKIYAQD